jgi:hypothetical protein
MLKEGVPDDRTRLKRKRDPQESARRLPAEPAVLLTVLEWDPSTV